jgi:hypothetical protein
MLAVPPLWFNRLVEPTCLQEGRLDFHPAEHACQRGFGVLGSMLPQIRFLRGCGHLGFGFFEKLLGPRRLDGVDDPVDNAAVLIADVGPVKVEVGPSQFRLGQLWSLSAPSDGPHPSVASRGDAPCSIPSGFQMSPEIADINTPI